MASKSLKGRCGTGLTGSQPLGVNAGTEDVEEVVFRRIRELITFFTGAKWPHFMRADEQRRHSVVVAFGDLLLDLG